MEKQRIKSQQNLALTRILVASTALFLANTLDIIPANAIWINNRLWVETWTNTSNLEKVKSRTRVRINPRSTEIPQTWIRQYNRTDWNDTGKDNGLSNQHNLYDNPNLTNQDLIDLTKIVKRLFRKLNNNDEYKILNDSNSQNVIIIDKSRNRYYWKTDSDWDIHFIWKYWKRFFLRPWNFWWYNLYWDNWE